MMIQKRHTITKVIWQDYAKNLMKKPTNKIHTPNKLKSLKKQDCKTSIIHKSIDYKKNYEPQHKPVINKPAEIPLSKPIHHGINYGQSYRK